jgi:hypothetical protein
MRRVRLAIVAAASLLACMVCGAAVPTVCRAQAPAGGAGERFYYLLFTAQDALKNPRETHTWAVMVRMVDARIVETQTISWLPSDLRIKPASLVVEPGANLSCDATIRWSLSHARQRIALWGPYEAAPELYARFVARKAQLESGALGYQCLDMLGEAALRKNGVNCVHSLTAIEGPATDELFRSYGHSSGLFMSQSLATRGLIGPYSGCDEWLLPALGLRQTPLERRSTSPTVNTATRPGSVFAN